MREVASKFFKMNLIRKDFSGGVLGGSVLSSGWDRFQVIWRGTIKFPVLLDRVFVHFVRKLVLSKVLRTTIQKVF